MASWPYSTPRWKRLRLAILQDEPLCRECRKTGQVVPAHDVDHVVPVSAGGEPFDQANLQPLCRRCHNRKINESEGGAWNPRRDRRVDAATGKPLAVDHWWNADEKNL